MAVLMVPQLDWSDRILLKIQLILAFFRSQLLGCNSEKGTDPLNTDPLNSMQIEENFRDTKSLAYGFGIATARDTSFERAANLLLVAALAHFLLWLIGTSARAHRWDYSVRVTSVACPNAYSTIFLARLVIQQCHNRLPRDCLDDATGLVAAYLQTVTET